MDKCQMCEDGGYDTPATKKDGDGVPLCDRCWNELLDGPLARQSQAYRNPLFGNGDDTPFI